MFVSSVIPGVAAVDTNDTPVFYNEVIKPVTVTVNSYSENNTLVSSVTYTSSNVSLAELITPVFNSETYEHIYRRYTFTDEEGTYRCTAGTNTNISTPEDAAAQIKLNSPNWPYYNFTREKFTEEADGMTLEIYTNSNRPT